MPDIEKRLAAIEKKLDAILKHVKELRNAGAEDPFGDALTADMVTGTSDKLDEILRLLKELIERE